MAALIVLLSSKYEETTVSQIIFSSLAAAVVIEEDGPKGEAATTTVLAEKATTTGEATTTTTTAAIISTSTLAPDGVTLPIWERAKLENIARAREKKEQTSDSSQQFCTLRVCQMRGSEAPVLFVSEHSDGAGHRMKNILDGLAVASKNKMNFGGVLTTDNLVTEHGHDFHSLANRILGDGTSPSHLFVTERPNFTEKFESLTKLENERPRLLPRGLFLLPDTSQWSKGGDGSSYYSDELRQALRLQLSLVPLVFAPNRPAVALHVRRGDLPQTDARVVQTPDEYYFRLVDRIRAFLPQADVHAWSSVQGYSAMGKKQYWSSSDFDSYRQKGIAVHLDGTDLMQPWAHLSRAHVFVMAPSSFSYVPAVLNPHCVVFRKLGVPLFPGWIDGEKLSGAPGDGLESCVRRGWS